MKMKHMLKDVFDLANWPQSSELSEHFLRITKKNQLLICYFIATVLHLENAFLMQKNICCFSFRQLLWLNEPQKMFHDRKQIKMHWSVAVLLPAAIPTSQALEWGTLGRNMYHYLSWKNLRLLKTPIHTKTET